MAVSANECAQYPLICFSLASDFEPAGDGRFLPATSLGTAVLDPAVLCHCIKPFRQLKQF
jgi:hypothetical protein